MNNKLYVAFALSFSLLVCGTVSVSAAEPVRYVPVIPEFLTVGNGVSVNTPFDVNSSDAKAFLKDFYTSPYLVVVRQETDTDYIPRLHTSLNDKYVGKDKHWSLQFLKPKAKALNYSFEFTYFNTSNYRDFTPYPMSVYIKGDNKWEILQYDYNLATKKFSSGNVHNFTGDVKFSYVIDSGLLSKPVSKYPYYSNLGGHDFITQSYNLDGNAHYDWWIGKKRTNPNDDTGVIKPPSGGGDDGGGTSSNPTSSGGTSSGGGGSGTYPKPGVGGDGDIPMVDGSDGDLLVTLTMKFFYYKNGVKTPFNFSDGTHNLGTSKAATYYLNSTASIRFGMSIDNYVTEFNSYRWLMNKDREVEVFFYPVGGGGTSSDGGGTSSNPTSSDGGGSSSDGGGTSSGGSGGNTGDGDDSDTPSSLIPIIPFDPNWWEKFEPATEDPWNGFDIFEGITKPKPIEFPDSILVPNKDDPFKNWGVPNMSEPPIKYPVVDDPFYGWGTPDVTEPPLNIPKVDDPFHGWGTPNVTEPPLNIPKVDDPFKAWGSPNVDELSLNIPKVDDPFNGWGAPNVEEPSLNIPIVDDPFKNWGKFDPSNPLYNLIIPKVDDPFKNWGK